MGEVQKPFEVRIEEQFIVPGRQLLARHVLWQQRKFDEAKPYFDEAAEVSQRIDGGDNQRSIMFLKQAIRFYESWHAADPEGGYDATVATYQKQLDAMEPTTN